MRPLPGYKMWIGNAGDLHDPQRVLAMEISAVVELADSEPLAQLPREIIRYRFPLSDGGDNSAWLLSLAVDAVAALLREKVSTLVCCSAGMSRSLCIGAAGIAVAEGRSFEQVLSRIAESGPADVSPMLVEQLQQMLDER